MKILFLGTEGLPVPPPKGGGSEKFAYAIAYQLHATGHDVTVLSLPLQTESELRTISLSRWPRETEMNGLSNRASTRFLAFRISTTSFILAAKRAISKLLSEEEYDIIHSQTPAAGLAAVLSVKKRKPKRIMTSHGYYTLYPQNASTFNPWLTPVKWLENSLNHYVEDTALSQSDLVTVVSDSLRRNILASLPQLKSRIRVIRAQVDYSRYGNIKAGDAMKRKLGIEGRQVVLYAGRITRIKGIEYLLRAIVDIVTRFPDVVLVIVGPAAFSEQVAALQEGYLQELHRIIDQHDIGANILFAGYLTNDQLIQAYSSADIVVVPSVWEEPCSVSILEGMASSKPVIATNVGGNPELVIDGVTGTLVRPKDVRALSSALQQLLENKDLRTAYGIAGRKRVEAQFSWEAVADQMLGVYQEAVSH